VDFVMTVGSHRIPIEVKYQATIDPVHDVRGLKSFVDKEIHRAPFALLVTRHDSTQDHDPRIIPISLPTLMLLR
jgi:hypothetical protein